LRFERAGAEVSVHCASCGQALARGAEAWKSTLAPVERTMSGIMAAYTTMDGVKLREYVCPGCGALLECETVYEDDPPLLDFMGAFPDA
jgi:acetone carboxylase gamma subunit